MLSELFHVCMGKDRGLEGRKHEHLERSLVAALESDYHAALERKSPCHFYSSAMPYHLVSRLEKARHFALEMSRRCGVVVGGIGGEPGDRLVGSGRSV